MPSHHQFPTAALGATLRRLWKPWFVYHPTQVVRRVIAAVRPPPQGYSPIQTSWGVRIIADPTRAIGRSIVYTGIYDLAVSEALARLISPGDTVVDAGANIGYMTILASIASGRTGRVLSFEPHPDLFRIVQKNVATVGSQFQLARTELHQAALGESRGRAELHLPPDFTANDGIARLGEAAVSEGRSVTVNVETLDDVLGTDCARVLKLDVEGFERQVVRGMSRILAEHRVRHIVFEDHNIARSEVAQLLRIAGYTLLSLGWRMRGPAISPIESGSIAASYEAPNFVATLDLEEVEERFRPHGWLVLKRGFSTRCE